ncbi:hypothetical protein [Streptomyces sp. NBC_00046]|uniref:hypothetical protein n=1 Tax=unclassified Streptomyces TaxID=2593676 RepID=UPI003246B4B2
MSVFAFSLYALINTKSVTLLILGMVLGQVLQSAMYAPLGPLLSEMFSTRVRYTRASLGYRLAALIGGGFTPLFASSLLSASGGVSSAPLATLAMGCGLHRDRHLAHRRNLRTGPVGGGHHCAAGPPHQRRARVRGATDRQTDGASSITNRVR